MKYSKFYMAKTNDGSSADPDEKKNDAGESDLPLPDDEDYGYDYDDERKKKTVTLIAVIAGVVLLALIAAVVLIVFVGKNKPGNVRVIDRESTVSTAQSETGLPTEQPSGEPTTAGQTNEPTTEAPPTNTPSEEPTSEPTGEPTTHTHEFGEWTVAREATCTEEGEKERVCACGEKETETIPPTGHDYGDWTTVKAATCTEDGLEERACALCGNKESRTISAVGHNYGDWVVTKKPTDTKDGEETRTCTVCGDKITRPIDKAPHNYEAIRTVAPTCTEQGYTVYVCSDCGKTKNDDYTAKLGHDWGAPVYEWSPDRSKVTAVVTCTRDSSHKQSETVSTTVKTTATCEADGERIYTATFRNTLFGTQTASEPVAALGHRWSSPVYEWSEDFGSVTATCTCKNDSSHTVSETAATTVSKEIAATCIDEGLRTYTATFRNALFTKQTKSAAIEALGHIWGAPSYVWSEDNGSVTATCVCTRDGSHKLEETVEAAVTETTATCEKSGQTVYTAVFEDTAFTKQTKSETVPPLGHDYQNGVCTRCGDKQPVPQFVVSSAKGAAGDSVKVTISIKNNPGVWGMDLDVIYDGDVLTLTNVTNGDFFGDGEWTPGQLSRDSYRLSYESDDPYHNKTAKNGVLAVLTFEINVDAAGSSTVKLVWDGYHQVVINADGEDVAFEVVTGTVTVTES